MLNTARLIAMEAEKGGVQINLTRGKAKVGTRDTFSTSGEGMSVDAAVDECWENLMENIEKYKQITFYEKTMEEKLKRLLTRVDKIMSGHR